MILIYAMARIYGPKRRVLMRFSKVGCSKSLPIRNWRAMAWSSFKGCMRACLAEHNLEANPMEKKAFDRLATFSSNNFVRKRIWQTESLHCNIYCFEPGQQNSLHRHPVSDEVVFCLEGAGIVVVGTGHQPIKAGETVLVPMNTPHPINGS